MDIETGCDLPSTGKKARLLIGTAHWFWNSIGWFLAVGLRALAWENDTSKKIFVMMEDGSYKIFSKMCAGFDLLIGWLIVILMWWIETVSPTI